MPSPTVREFGRKPYIDPGKGLDGGYVNSMRRTTQLVENVNGPRAGITVSRRPIPQNDSPGAALAYGLISVATLSGVSWGIAFDAAGGLYYSITGGDIYYNHVALSQTVRDWEEMSVAPNGNVYCVAFAVGIYVRTGGTGDFTLLEAGAFTCVACAVNGDIYALKANQIWLWNGTAFDSLAQAVKGYTGLTCAPNGDIYATVQSEGKIYVRAGGTGDFVDMGQTVTACRALAAASNGDIFLAPYTAFDYHLYRRAGGSGNFETFFDVARPTQCMAISSGGVLYLSSSVTPSDDQVYMLNTTTTVPPPKDTITQTYAQPTTVERPLRKNLKPYYNRSFAEMQQFAQPMEYNGTERKPETEQARPILVDHIPPIHWYVRSGSPVVVDVPTTARDPISRIEVISGDGFGSVAPNGISIIFKPGLSSMAVLVAHTRSGQQCSVNLMAKV